MTKALLGCIWLGATLFVLAAQADSILLVSDPVRGDPTATISGRVTNSRGKPLGGALIEATSLGSHFTVGAKTSKHGSYGIADLPPGPYRVTARMLGFRTIVNPGFKAEAQDKTALNFCMDCGSVPGSNAGGAGGTGSGVAGGGSSKQAGTATQSAADNPLTLADFSSLAPNSRGSVTSKPDHFLSTASGGVRSSLNEHLQVQHGANGGTQQAPVHVNSSIDFGVGGNLPVDSLNVFPLPKRVTGRLLNLSGKNSDSILALGQFDASPASSKSAEFARGYGLFPGSFTANVRSVPAAAAELRPSGMVTNSESRLESARATEKTTVKGNDKGSGDPSENIPDDQVAAVLDAEGNGHEESTVSAVGEPSSLFMLGSGLICLAILARRHNSRRKERSLAGC